MMRSLHAKFFIIAVLTLTSIPALAQVLTNQSGRNNSSAHKFDTSLENVVFEKGEDYTAPDSSLITHRSRDEIVQIASGKFHLSVNGIYTGTYCDKNCWGGIVQFGQFEFASGYEVTIDVDYTDILTSFEVLPKSLDLKRVEFVNEHRIRITTDHPDQNITIIPNGNPQGDVLHIFAQSIDQDSPCINETYSKITSNKLYYFGPGYHNVKDLTGNEDLSLPDGWTVYVAAGAVVEGRITSRGNSNVTVKGRGMVIHDTRTTSLQLDAVKNCRVDGLFFFLRNHNVWQAPLWKCSDVHFNNVKIACTGYASSDGIDIQYCQDCTFRNSFVRACDDCVSIKGMDTSSAPATMPTNENLIFENLQMWSDCNNGFTVGEESAASIYQNIQLLNSCVLYSYDDVTHHDDRDWCDCRAAWSIICLNATYMKDILVDGLDVYHCERFLSIGFWDHFWNQNAGDQSWAGGISNVTLRNITSYGTSNAKCGNQIQLIGWKQTPDTPEKFIDGVVFDNVKIGKKRLSSTNDSLFYIGPNVRNITFKSVPK